MAVPAATLIDGFNTTLDRVKWVSTTAAPNVYYDTPNQRVGIVCTSSFYTLGTDFSTPGYTIQNSSIYAKWTPSTPVSGRESHFDLQTTGRTNVISFLVYGTNLIATVVIAAGGGGDVASVPYNATNHAWLRIRHSGTTLFWETSLDGRTWNAFASRSYPFAFDAWAVNFSTGGTAGGTDMFVDSVNVSPAGPVALAGEADGTGTASGTLSTPAATGPAQMARVDLRALVNGIPPAQVARVDLRALTTNTPPAWLARVDLRSLSTSYPSAQIARVDLRVLVKGPFPLLIKVWNGSAFVLAPVKVWNGSAFVAPVAVRTWNGTAFV